MTGNRSKTSDDLRRLNFECTKKQLQIIDLKALSKAIVMNYSLKLTRLSNKYFWR